jgi:DNA-binding response OmpR family regulator
MRTPHQDVTFDPVAVSLRKGGLEGPARVLVVAEAPLAKLVTLTLSHGVYATKVLHDVDEAEREKKSWRPHVFLVDLDLQPRSPLFLIGQHIAGRRLPTIAFTTPGDLKTKMLAFEHGADDIIAVPFFPEELVARMFALTRRVYGEAVPFIPVVQTGSLEIDMFNQRVRVGATMVDLTPIEQALLYLLASNSDRVIGREEILDALWGSDYVVESNVIDRHIRNLRIKLKDDWRKPRYIRTVAGRGYQFVEKAG